MERTQILDWRNSSMTSAKVAAGDNISLTGTYNYYNSTDKHHRLHTSSCSPTVQNTAFASDISAVVRVRADSDSQTKMFLYWYMPDYAYTDTNTWFTGTVRLFSPVTRESARNYCQLQPYSTTYNNMSNILAHSFTNPYNSVLYLNKYQGDNETPTAALEKVTADVCSKLKAEYGSNLRIYLIEYRKQSQYKTFPAGATKAHSYKTIEDCAYTTYTADSETALKSKLDTIATDIKSWAGYTEAKNVE